MTELRTKKLVSIVIPCYKSEKTIKPVVDEIVEEFGKQEKYDYEIILVNDGSPDELAGVIDAICAANKKVAGINLSRNFGQGSAIMAGAQFVHGDYMITMDDDGQHPPSGIFSLVDRIEQGYDIVYAYFSNKHHSLFKRVASRLNRRSLILLGKHAGKYHPSSFVGYSKFSTEAIKRSESPVVAVSGYVAKLTNKITEVELGHRDRLEGTSTYTLHRLFLLWRRNVTSFSTKILDLAIYTGALCAIASFLYALIVAIRKFIEPSMQVGYASTIVLILFLAGIIMLLIGILGDYLGKVFMILVRMPVFYIRDIHKNCYFNEQDDCGL